MAQLVARTSWSFLPAFLDYTGFNISYSGHTQWYIAFLFDRAEDTTSSAGVTNLRSVPPRSANVA